MNWGYKLTIGIITFMLFIVILVVMMFKNDSDALIDKEYYEKGQSFDTEYQHRKNAVDDNFIPAVTNNAEGVWISFAEPVTYELLLRRLADASMDTTLTSSHETRHIDIPKGSVPGGAWTITITYHARSKTYLFDKRVFLP